MFRFYLLLILVVFVFAESSENVTQSIVTAEVSSKNVEKNITTTAEMSVEDMVAHIEKAYENAVEGKSKLTEEILKIEGMTGKKTKHFYNNLLTFPEGNVARYLEVGSWKGSSSCSAAYKNKAHMTFIDNWSEFGGTIDAFKSNLIKCAGGDDSNVVATIYEIDAFKVNVTKLNKFNFYLYDGGHTRQEHYLALKHFYESLDEVFVYICDDWNWAGVRIGTYAAIYDLELSVLYEKEIRTSMNNTVPAEPELSDNWWNGVYVAVLTKNVKTAGGAQK